MSDLKDQLNRVYVAIGDKNNLIDRGVMEKGGLLRSKDINENTDYSEFDQYQKDALASLAIGSSKMKMITEHPDASYHLEGEDAESALIIDDAEAFWSLSKILIVKLD